MKRSLVIVIPILLLIVLNACNIDMGALPPYSTSQWTAIAQTQEVMGRPGNERIRNLLNNRLNYDTFVQLEDKLVGTYTVTGVNFPYTTYFQVHMNCECADGSACCDARRMFFITLYRFSLSRDQVLAEIKDPIQYMDVVCYDHTRAFEVVQAPWDKVKGFLTGSPQVSAADLASSITSRKMP